MKPFTKKQNFIFMFLSILFFTLSMLIVLFSKNFFDVIQIFLEEKVFHRSFDINKWANTINSLIAFPIFFVIFFDTILFQKFNNKSKIILLCFYAIFLITCTGIVTSLTSYNNADSDLISELLLGKECYLSKTFWPTSWNYSTEFRTINTQLITAPLFLFTSNLHLIKTISVVLLILFLPICLLFLLNELKIQELWIKILACTWILCPTSNLIWSFTHFGSYYIPHICIIFCFLGLFFGIIYNDYSKRKKNVYLVLFYLLSFISGLSGIRYILYFEVPLATLYLWKQTKSFITEKKQFTIKSFFLDIPKVKLSFTSLVISGFGYITNSFILSKFYSYDQYNTATFKTFGDPSLSTIFGDIIQMFGYRNNVSVFSPAGITNILVYVFIAFFLLCLFISIKKNSFNILHKEFLFFVSIMAIYNCFFITNTLYNGRYLILPFVFVIPCTIVLIANKPLSILYRNILAFSFSIIVFTSSALLYVNLLHGNKDQSKINLTEFINDNDYHYGYATFWNANVMTYLTDGKIELAHYGYPEKYGLDSFHAYKWLTPERYYTDDFGNNEKIIFIVSKDEFNLEPNAKIFANGKQVFNDEYYYVFEYKDNKTFKESF